MQNEQAKAMKNTDTISNLIEIQAPRATET